MNYTDFTLGFILALTLILLGGWRFYRYIQNHFIRMMIREIPSPMGYAETLEKLESNISSHPEWHTFNVVDQGKEIVDNGGKSIGRMTILQFCHGPLASRMFSNENRRRMSVFSPRSISVYEKADGKAYVAIMNGDLMMKFTDAGTRAVIQNVAKDVKSMLAFLHS